METLDRYLRAVRPLLPRAQRDDIVAELSEEIRSQMAAREAALGRPLSADDEDDVLRGYGHPMLVGGRYQAAQGHLAFGRELIGPELFPFYVGAIKYTFAVSLTIQAVVLAALSFWEPLTFGGILNAVWLHVVIQFAVLTLVFCGLQVQVTRFPNEWDSERTSSERAAAERQPTPASVRFESACEFVVLLLVLRGLFALHGASGAALGPLRLAPVWGAATLPALVAVAATMIQALAIAFRPDWVRYRRPVRAAALAVWLGAVGYLLQAGPWVVAAGPRVPEKLPDLNRLVFHNGLLAVGATLVVALVWEIVGFWRERAKPV